MSLDLQISRLGMLMPPYCSAYSLDRLLADQHAAVQAVLARAFARGGVHWDDDRVDAYVQKLAAAVLALQDRAQASISFLKTKMK